MVEFLPVGEEPPKRTSIMDPATQAMFESVRKELRKSPGRWAYLDRGVAPSRATFWRKGLGKTFEVTMRQVGFDGKGKKSYDIYGRRSALATDTRK